MSVKISSEVHAQLIALAQSKPDQEVCGLLFGSVGQIESYRKTPNVAPDPAIAFELDPKTLIAAHKAARAGGPHLIGHFHSHPNGRAGPSDHDRAAAAGDGAVWLIIAGDCISAWRTDTPQQLSPVDLVLTD